VSTEEHPAKVPVVVCCEVGSAFALPVWTAGTYPECQQKISTDVGRQSSQPADHFLSTPCRLGICSPAWGYPQGCPRFPWINRRQKKSRSRRDFSGVH